MSTKPSEYEGPRRKRADTASEKLRSLYQSGDESGTKKRDDGSTFSGLLPLDELRKLRDNDD